MINRAGRRARYERYDCPENPVELVLCKTWLDCFGLGEQVEAGIVGSMPDIIYAMIKADKVISL